MDTENESIIMDTSISPMWNSDILQVSKSLSHTYQPKLMDLTLITLKTQSSLTKSAESHSN